MAEHVHTATKIMQVANRIYFENGRYRRGFQFLIRALFFYKREMRHIFKFMEASVTRQDLLRSCDDIMDYVPRRLLFAKSTSWERVNAIQFHFSHLEKVLGPQRMLDVTRNIAIPLYSREFDDKSKLTVHLSGIRKEGFFTVELFVDDEFLYRINAWMDAAPACSQTPGVPAFWIGALQGLNGDRAAEKIKACAKHMASYRPKNLIFYLTRAVARALECQTIIAVSNAGFYANNGLRFDRKLKTNLDEFWTEAGGNATSDPRFFELPVVEHRKSLEEMKPNKRSMYRKRFVLLDEVDASVAEALKH